MLDTGSPVPLYHQLTQQLERRIARGDWAADEPLPPEHALIAEYGVSRTTVRQALAELERAGAIYRIQGKGTFVAQKRVVQPLAQLTGPVEELMRQGLSPVIKLLDRQIVPAPARVAADLQLELDQEVLVMERVVNLDGYPLYLDTSYFRLELAPFLDEATMASSSIYACLDKNGWPPSHGRQSISAVALPADKAHRLWVEPGAPALAITRVTSAAGNVPIEWTRLYYRADRYQYDVSLQRRP